MFKNLMSKSHASSKSELAACPMCKRIPSVEFKDVEPQADPWFSGKTIYFIKCECGLAFFNGAFHEGFLNPSEAKKAWNAPLVNSTHAEKSASTVRDVAKSD